MFYDRSGAVPWGAGAEMQAGGGHAAGRCFVGGKMRRLSAITATIN